MQNRITGSEKESMSLQMMGQLISEKTQTLLNLKVRDTITLEKAGKKIITVKVGSCSYRKPI